jgi:hypothetical protein
LELRSSGGCAGDDFRGPLRLARADEDGEKGSKWGTLEGLERALTGTEAEPLNTTN